MQRQCRSGAEARKAPVASPNFAKAAPSWVGSLAARQVWPRFAQGRAASRQELCQIGPLSRAGALPSWRRTRLRPSRACSLRRLGCFVYPLGSSIPACCSLGFQAPAPCPSFRSRIRGCSPELGLWAGAQTHRCRTQTPAHVSAGEESAREPTCVRQLLGAHGVRLEVCGAPEPRQGPKEPGAHRAALSLGGQATAGGDLHLPFPSL